MGEVPWKQASENAAEVNPCRTTHSTGTYRQWDSLRKRVKHCWQQVTGPPSLHTTAISISISISISASFHASMYLFICLCIYVSMYLSVSIYIYTSIYTSMYISIYLSIDLSIHEPIDLSIHPCIYRSINLTLLSPTRCEWSECE